MEYIDIGINLFNKQFNGKIEAVIDNAKENKVGVIITGSSLENSLLAGEYVKGKSDIYSTVGIHPHAAKNCTKNTITELKKIITGNSGVVAVGECGLDYDRMFTPREIQKVWFENQINLAEEMNLPLFLHERAAVDDFYTIMNNHKKLCNRSVVHCFTGDAKTAVKYLDLGCFIGITGWICDERRNHDLVEALKYIPIEKLMIETDSPYLIPKNVKGLGGTNTPSNIKYVLEKIAKQKQIDYDVLKIQIYKNTISFFDLKIQDR